MLTNQKLPESALKKILQEYDLGKIKKTEPMLSSGNISYFISADSGKYILRLCPEGDRWRSKEEIASELELINYLKRNGFPVYCPTVKKDKKEIIEYKNKFGYLRKYESARAILRPNIKQIGEFGRTVGWFHKLTEGYQTKNKRKHLWDLKTTRDNFLEAKDFILKSNFPQANVFIERLEKELFSLSFPDDLPQGMLHEDLGKRHILWRGDKISCLLDFDRCYYGKLILDLGQALRGWCFVNNWRNWSNQNFNSLLKGYSQKRKLAGLEKEYLFEAIKFGVLERGLSFCLRYIEATQDPLDQKFAHQSVFDFLKILEKNRKKLKFFKK